VAAKGGEELQIVREAAWRPALVQQAVVGGDTLRTGEIGTLGITFVDQTTVRVGRRSTLIVNQIAAGAGSTELTVPAGDIWARASRGGSSVTVKTPAASAAIRGTDWSISVAGDRTSLAVFEGEVEFANPQGSVTVGQGEGATARIGERPTKIVLVRPDDREQMLFYLELRSLFRSLPATPLDGPARRAERRRLAAIPEASRTTEDWIAVAEAGVGHDPRTLVEQAVGKARLGLGGRFSGRLDLVEGLLAGTRKRYSEAAALFSRATLTTTGARREIARCGYFAAATLAQPKRRLPAPALGGPDSNVCAAFVAGFEKGLTDAETILRKTESAHPRHLLSSLLSAQVSLLLNRRDEMRATVARMNAIDPDSPEALLAAGYLKLSLDSDLDGAVSDFNRAVAIAPGDASLWNGLGLAQGERDALREAEAAFRTAIAVDPEDPVAYTNLAILLLDQSRVDEAARLVETALTLDPSFYAGYIAKGRVFLQKGDMPRAMESLLAGSAANPASAQGLLALAIAKYQGGELDVAAQALDNADRLDPNDPVTSIARTAIAIDQRDADAAILNAREAVRRYRNRGGYFAALAATRTGGSYLGQAYGLLGLDDWGRFYTDRVADPFSATTYFDQSSVRRARPIFSRPTLDQLDGLDFAEGAGNLVLQGLLLDPLAASGRLGRIDLLRRPFLDVEVGGSLVSRNGKTGWRSEVTLQAFANDPVPTSVSLSASRTRTSHRGAGPGGEDAHALSTFVGLAPDAANRFLFWGVANATAPDLLTPAINILDADRDRLRSYQAGAGWSHTLGYRHVLTGAIVASRAEQSRERLEIIGLLDPFVGLFPATFETRQRRDVTVDTTTAAVGHMIGLGDLTLRSGIEGQRGVVRGFSAQTEALAIPVIPVTFRDGASEPVRSRFDAGRAFANLQWRLSDAVQFEAGAEGLLTDYSGSPRTTALDPRLGIAIAPIDGHWLRAMWRRDTEMPASFSLAPITTVGLAPHPLPVQLGGRKETTALRWDAEWTPRFFTAVEYQRQRATDLRIGIPETLDYFDLARARIDVLTVTANAWLSSGIGLFATLGAVESGVRDATGREVDIPYAPRRFARAGLTFVHTSRFKLTLVENYIGARSDAPGGVRLDDVWTTDVTASYETPDRRLTFGVAVLNLFDKRYDQVAARSGSESIPGAGRTVAGSLKVRF
jgi:tetratricopeptide (TPR) repeat protein